MNFKLNNEETNNENKNDNLTKKEFVKKLCEIIFFDYSITI